MPVCPNCGTQVEYCPCCGQPLTAGAGPPEPFHQPAHAERVLWEGRPGLRAGFKLQPATYRVTSKRVQIVHTGFSQKVEEIELAHFREARVIRSLIQRGSAGNLVILGSAPNASMLMFEDIPEPERVRDILQKAAQAEMQRLAAQRPAQGASSG